MRVEDSWSPFSPLRCALSPRYPLSDCAPALPPTPGLFFDRWSAVRSPFLPVASPKPSREPPAGAEWRGTVRVHKQDGKFAEERTYPRSRDPRVSPG
jgi:hypothetical protein